MQETTEQAVRQSEGGYSLKFVANVDEIDLDTYVFNEDIVESKLREYFACVNAPIHEIRELR